MLTNTTSPAIALAAVRVDRRSVHARHPLRPLPSADPRGAIEIMARFLRLFQHVWGWLRASEHDSMGKPVIFRNATVSTLAQDRLAVPS